MTVDVYSSSLLSVNVLVSSADYSVWLLSGVTFANGAFALPVMKFTGSGDGLISDGTILSQYSGTAIEMTGIGSSLDFGTSSLVRAYALVGTPAILMSGGSSSFTNHGLITATNAVAVVAVSALNSLYNDGRIEGGSGGLFLGTNGGSGDSLVNDGTIIAGIMQTPVFSDRFNHAVQVEGDGTIVINHGSLVASATFGAGVHIGSASILHGANSLVENYGTITSALWYGVDMHNLTNGGASLFNYGQISGALNGSVLGSLSADKVINAGLMRGDVFLAGGNDLYDGRGGVVFGSVMGYDGNDTLIGGAQDDSLFGDVGNDLMRGGAGDDTLNASVGHDTILGGTGDDTITGGTGRDVMTGGAGEDVFQFATAAAVGNSVAASDVIRDFTSKLDLIDLGTLPGTLNFIGAAAFSNVANQLRYTLATGILEGDTNGNGTADFMLFLQAGTVLAAGDLIL